MRNNLILSLKIVIFSIQLVSSALVCRETQTILALPTQPSADVYDGMDSIYIFGGFNSDEDVHFSHIQKYSLSQDTIQTVGHLPVGLGRAAAVTNKNTGDVFHVGGADDRNTFRDEVYRYSPDSSQVDQIAILPEGREMGRMIQLPGDNETAYMFVHNGDWQGEPKILVLKLDLSNDGFEPTTIGHLDADPNFFPTGVMPVSENNDEVLVFGCIRFSSSHCMQAIRYSLSTNTSTLVPIPSMPIMDPFGSSAVWERDPSGALFTYFNSPNLGGGFVGTRFIRYSYESNQAQEMTVEDYPSHKEPNGMWYGPGMTYVPASRRIYFFGGLLTTMSDYEVLQKVWYIDLSEQ